MNRKGGEGRYYLASRAARTEDLELSTGKTRTDGVAVYALCGPERDKVLLIRQFRWPIGSCVYEFPAGLVEPGEDYLEAAGREVSEETGLVFTPLETDPLFTRPRYMTDGMTDEACALVYGYADGDVANQHLEDTEEIEVVLADRAEVRHILSDERVAGNAAIHLMHFLSDGDPFAFLYGGRPVGEEQA